MRGETIKTTASLWRRTKLLPAQTRQRACKPRPSLHQIRTIWRQMRPPLRSEEQKPQCRPQKPPGVERARLSSSAIAVARNRRIVWGQAADGSRAVREQYEDRVKP